ncbi:MAG: histidine phosphatase family protein [Planctomycetota bacterium]
MSRTPIALLSVFALLFSVSLAAPPAHADDHAEDQYAPTPELVDALRGGGYVIYIRHAQTEKDYADQVTADPNDGSTQRVLSEAGWHQAKAIGQGFRKLAIPVGHVYTSEYFRAWQTADLAFGRYEKLPQLNFLPFEDYTEDQVKLMQERVKPLVVEVPDDAMNTVIVAHDDPFEAVTGIYPEPQGTAYVLKPDGEGDFKVVARVEARGWLALAEAE